MKRILTATLILSLSMINSTLHSQGAQKERQKEQKAEKTNIPAGFGDLQWGTSIDQSKSMVAGKIVYTDEKNRIISKDGDVEYLYGFFYMDPQLIAGEGADDTQARGEFTDPSLFYVSVRFPYLTKSDVQKKIEEQYGEPTGEDLINNQGAVIWDSEKTRIIMWVDNYEDRPFCKKINYVSKDIALKINDYQQRVFNRREIEILKRLSL